MPTRVVTIARLKSFLATKTETMDITKAETVLARLIQQESFAEVMSDPTLLNHMSSHKGLLQEFKTFYCL